MHDPFQNYQLLGAYSGGATPFGLPYAGVQNPALHPGALTGHPLAHLLAQGPFQNPLLQNPLLQNPLFQNPLLQNPLFQNPLQQHPLLSALQNPYQTIPQQPFGYPLAPQTMIGAGNPYGGGQQIAGQPYGSGQVGFGQPQIHPLIAQQIALRSLATAGISPWACY